MLWLSSGHKVVKIMILLIRSYNFMIFDDLGYPDHKQNCNLVEMAWDRQRYTVLLIILLSF